MNLKTKVDYYYGMVEDISKGGKTRNHNHVTKKEVRDIIQKYSKR